MATKSQTPIGTRRMSYEMQPLGANGMPINGGNHYANADTIERAREWANQIVSKGEHLGYTIYGVSITGEMMELSWDSWKPVTGLDARFEHEVIRRTRPVPLSANDERKSCYPTTILDFYEVVHERRSDGSCRCGKHGPRFT